MDSLQTRFNAMSPAERATFLETLQSPAGGWTRQTTSQLGVPWPLKAGWKARLIEEGITAPPVSVPVRQKETREQWLRRRVLENPSTRLDFAKACEIRRLHAEGVPREELAERFDVAVRTINQVLSGKRWKPELWEGDVGTNQSNDA